MFLIYRGQKHVYPIFIFSGIFRRFCKISHMIPLSPPCLPDLPIYIYIFAKPYPFCFSYTTSQSHIMYTYYGLIWCIYIYIYIYIYTYMYIHVFVYVSQCFTIYTQILLSSFMNYIRLYHIYIICIDIYYELFDICMYVCINIYLF